MPTPAAPVLRWLHSDPDLASAMAAAETRAKSGDWKGASNAEMRAFLLRVLAAAAAVGGEAPHQDRADAKTLVVNVRPSPRTDDKAFQDGIMRALAAFILGREKGDKYAFTGERTAFTVGNDPGLAQPVAAAFTWPVAAAVIGVAGFVATLIYGLVSQTNEIEAVKVQTDAKKIELATTLQTTVEVIENHKRREAEAGQSLPYDEAELRFLETLEKNTVELTGWNPPPLQSIPPVKKVGEKVGQAVAGGVERVGEGLSIGLPIALALGVYMLTR